MARGGRIYSVGYEGLSPRGLVDRLAGSDVKALIDVRLNAMSRKPGFSKRALSEALTEAGIEYVHEPELGNPPDNRGSFRSGDGADGRKTMRKRLSNGSRPALGRLVARAKKERVAILCVERERDRCHRAVILEMAVELAPELQVLEVL